MTQEMVHGKNRKDAIKKFLKKHKKQKIYDVTRTFASYKKTKPKDRVYRVTGVSKTFYNKHIHRKRKKII